MQKIFNKQYIIDNKGCYSLEEVEKLSFIGSEAITALDIANSEMPLKDKFWFIVKKTKLTTRQKQDIAIGVAVIVLPIYEARHPENKAPREAIKAAKDYLNGFITLKVFIQKRDTAYAAAYAAAADATAYAAAYAAADAAAAAAAADATADAAAYAADAAAAYADAAAAYADAAAAYAAAYADAYAADAAAAYADAAYADAAAAYADAAAAYAAAYAADAGCSAQLLKFLTNFINNAE